MFQFIAHFFSSNSTHGTHSPFVYVLADEVIYNKNAQQNISQQFDFLTYSGRYNKLLNAILMKLGVREIIIDKNSKTIAENTALIKSVKDFNKEDLEVIKQCRVIILFDLYRDKKNRNRWHEIQTESGIDVTIDLFYFGLLFHRPQQRKENFKLKYPFWI